MNSKIQNADFVFLEKSIIIILKVKAFNFEIIEGHD